MSKPVLLSLSVVAIALGGVLALAQQTMAPYTAAQAGQGRSEYMANCASCHLANLGGGGEAPSLAAGNFMKSWGGKSTRELYSYIRSAMPLGKGGSLSDSSYANIIAFLLTANGATAGGTLLTPATDVRIGLIANGVVPPDIAAGTTRAAPSPPMQTGLTVAGRVASHTPVSDTIVSYTARRDWLMGWRNYQAGVIARSPRSRLRM
jgi:mono/diheme cytochrome c family protein